jgi:hypothetical protein
VSGDGWGLLLSIIFLALAIAGNVKRVERNDEKKSKLNQLRKTIDNQKGFKASYCLIKLPSKSIFDPDKPVGIAIDDQSKQVCLINNESLRFIGYGDIIESEVIAGGDTIIKTSRASQFAGAAVGGLLLGGVGAVIGGLSGKKVENQDIKNVLLKLLINDTSSPVHVIDFIETTDNGQQTNPKIALQEAKSLHDLVSVIIKQAEQETESKTKKQPEAHQASIAEQIAQLSELHKSGAISDDEFTIAKKKLLS